MHASPAPETGFRVDFPSRDAGSAAARAAQKSPMTSSPRPSTADDGRAQIRAPQRIGSGAPHRRLAVAVCSAAASVTAAECNVGPTEPSKACVLRRRTCALRTVEHDPFAPTLSSVDVADRSRRDARWPARVCRHASASLCLV